MGLVELLVRLPNEASSDILAALKPHLGTFLWGCVLAAVARLLPKFVPVSYVKVSQMQALRATCSCVARMLVSLLPLGLCGDIS